MNSPERGGNGVGPPLATERFTMVQEQLRRRGIRDERVLEAMLKVPRHEFVAPEHRSQAYEDHPVLIPQRQTTSQPYIIASMIQSAEVKAEDRVLEIGAGSGYQTAVLAELASRVVAVERHQDLAAGARAILERLGYRNVEIVIGDGTLGWPALAPYDVIIVSAAAPRIPPALTAQLAPGGRMVIPVGTAEEQVLQLARKQQDGSIVVRPLEGCRFVPLIGEQGFAA